ncbi:MAG TPA: glycerol dehydratase reactivase beta/small subunit family protein [Gaiellales bacterium]|nr:glycerol dehydratase reactivase beta/small subunit family protein [Gaiellales bacterium]
MSEPLVLAIVSPHVPESALAALRAGFEEEGVPLAVERAEGTGHELGRAAAARALLGIGLGVDARRACVVLAAAPGSAYLEAPLSAARAFAQDCARIAGRRPLRRPAI